MRKRIFYSITGVTLIALCIFSVFISSIMYNQIFETEKTNLKMEFPLVKKALLSQDGRSNFDTIISSSRITVINIDGTVTFDNRRDHTTMDNHADRVEVAALKNSSKAESTRLSDTLGKQTYYYAEKLDANTILRLSITMDSIYAIVLKIVPFMILIAILVIILSAFISSYVTKKIIAPLYNIDEPVYDELDQFYARIKEQERFIEKQKARIRQKKAEFEILTDNIEDGLVLLNSRNEVVAINNTAKLVFGSKDTKFLRKNAFELNHSDEFIASLEKAFLGKSCELILQIHNREYLLHISPVKRSRNGKVKIKGAIIIIVDNTEKVQAEKVRREFSANVSHELKTPLTSILGYAELIKTGMAKTEDIKGFSEKIYTEANSLLELIEDILKISRLDEMKQSFEVEDVQLKEIIETAILRLEIISDKKDVSVSHELDNVVVPGIKTVLEETLYNVLENAIKYNKEKGSVSVSLIEKKNKAKIVIKDTGIGIPADSIDRIFERFYRVDKSHSSNVKGTGLGLSIVKHAINLHSGTIEVKSDVGKGTEIIIAIPKK